MIPATLPPTSDRSNDLNLHTNSDITLQGRISEVSGRGSVARTSLIVDQVVRMQAQGEPVAWVQPNTGDGLFPPDLAQAGVDLEQLIIVQVPSRVADVLRATELLLRSGGFGLVVADVSRAEVSIAALSRLGGLVRQHQSALVMLSGRDASSPALGSLVSLRVVPQRSGASMGFVVQPELVRDKIGLGDLDPRVFAAPEGASSADRVVSFGDTKLPQENSFEVEVVEEEPRVALAS